MPNQDRRADVVVVGAGPIGAVAARSAALAGARTLLIERRQPTDRPSACTGLVSPRTLDALGVSDRSVLQHIRAVEAVSPGGRILRVRSDTAKAVVLDRVLLETELRTLAEADGVALQMGTEVARVETGQLRISGPEGEETIGAGVIILACGAESTIVEAAGFGAPSRTVLAAQAEIDHAPAAPDCVSVFLGASVAPRFFGWAVPTSTDRTRVGLAVPPSDRPAERLGHLLERRFPEAAVLSRAAGPIPIGPVSDPVGPGLLLVGDAAGHVKPLSGGGLYTGAICGRIAGRTAARASRAGDGRNRTLASYTDACERAIGKEIRFGLAARDLLESMSDAQIDDAFRAADHPDLLAFLGRYGDIDRLRELPRRLAKQWTLWKRLLPLLALLDGFVLRGSFDDATTSDDVSQPESRKP